MENQPLKIENNWKPIVLVGGGSGALVGLWTGLWIVGFLLLWSKGLLHPGVAVPEKYSGFLRVAPESVLALIWNILHLDLPTQPILLLFYLVAVGAVLGAVIVSTSRLTSLDPQSVGFRSFIWAVRSMFDWPVLLLCFGSIALVSVTTWTESIVLLFSVLPVVLITAVLVIPISLCQPKVVARTSAADWWKPTWPGISAVGIFLVIEFLAIFVGYLQPMVPYNWIVFYALALGAWFSLTTIAPLLQGKLLMAATSSERWDWQSTFQWRVIGPWIALHLWMLLIPILCLGPFLAVYVWLWKVVPVLATILESRDMNLPDSYQVVINAMNLTGNFGWFLLLIPASLFFWFGIAKFIAETNRVQSNATPHGFLITQAPPGSSAVQLP